jgi:hypothetical protein
MELQQAQIQITPVDNGFLIQIVNSDGSGHKSLRRIAMDRDKLIEEIKLAAENLYTVDPPEPRTPLSATHQTSQTPPPEPAA